MKSILLFCAIILIPVAFFGQKNASKKKDKYALTDKQRDQMLDNIPVKDGKILYDEIVMADSSMTRSQLFLKIRQWFAENFMDSKAVLEVSDSANGLFTGKGVYKYARVSGLQYRDGYVQFVINAAVKDAKFRYQLYSFRAYGENQSLLSDRRGYTEETDLDEIATMYQSGKRKGYCRTYLDGLANLVSFIKGSLTDLSKQQGSISDF